MSPCLEPSTTDAATLKTARVESSAVIDGIPRFSSFAAISCVDGNDVRTPTPSTRAPHDLRINFHAGANWQRREVDPPGDDVPSIDRVQDAVHEVVAHQRAGVARDVGRDATGAQVANDAAEGKR